MRGEDDSGAIEDSAYLSALKNAASFSPTENHEFGDEALRYRASIIAALPKLKVLDGALVGERCRRAIREWDAAGRVQAPALPPHGTDEFGEASSCIGSSDGSIYACNSCNFIITGSRYESRGATDCDACPGCYGMWNVLQDLGFAELAAAQAAGAVGSQGIAGAISEEALGVAMRAAVLKRRYFVARVADGTEKDFPTFGTMGGARASLLLEQTAKVKEKIAELRWVERCSIGCVIWLPCAASLLQHLIRTKYMIRTSAAQRKEEWKKDFDKRKADFRARISASSTLERAALEHQRKHK